MRERNRELEARGCWCATCDHNVPFEAHPLVMFFLSVSVCFSLRVNVSLFLRLPGSLLLVLSVSICLCGAEVS